MTTYRLEPTAARPRPPWIWAAYGMRGCERCGEKTEIGPPSAPQDLYDFELLHSLCEEGA